jgi:hypothetical protein
VLILLFRDHIELYWCIVVQQHKGHCFVLISYGNRIRDPSCAQASEE